MSTSRAGTRHMPGMCKWGCGRACPRSRAGQKDAISASMQARVHPQHVKGACRHREQNHKLCKAQFCELTSNKRLQSPAVFLTERIMDEHASEQPRGAQGTFYLT